jgi:hypothetical protein
MALVVIVVMIAVIHILMLSFGRVVMTRSVFDSTCTQ